MQKRLNKIAIDTNNFLKKYLKKQNKTDLIKPMSYGLFSGGKKIRSKIIYDIGSIFKINYRSVIHIGAAVECIHAYSLIHDDLPAMDNDDYRRGKLTNHKVYGEDTAILAGDGLLSYAFEFVATQTQNVLPKLVLQVLAKLGKASGAAGLVGGQIVDLASEGISQISEETLHFIHTNKTGALLEASVVCGAILAGASQTNLQKLESYAQNIGLAFQIVDDILDITATSQELGKTAGKDIKAQKATYPVIWGLEKSRCQAQKLVENAKAELEVFGEKVMPLIALADFMISRSN